jgi:hypothetical protein
MISTYRVIQVYPTYDAYSEVETREAAELMAKNILEGRPLYELESPVLQIVEVLADVTWVPQGAEVVIYNRAYWSRG